MSMSSDAYTLCEQLGIDPKTPDALGHLWEALKPSERAEVFPFARNYESERPTGWFPTDVAGPVSPPGGPGGYVLTDPAPDQWRMWNGTSKLVFQVVRRTNGHMVLRYTSGETALSTWRELHEASHEVAAPSDTSNEADGSLIAHAARARVNDAVARGRLTLPPGKSAARARVLAYEHIRRARTRFDADVPPTGRPRRPGDTPRLKVLDTAADNLARLCAVYLGGEGDRNRQEARAYALAFRLVSQSARRLSHRRLR